MTTIKLKNGSGAPTAGDLAQGEPALDLTNKRLYTEDSGGTVIEVGTNPGVDVTFADNRKAIFGAGSDLQIYHDGSNSYVQDAGDGALILNTTNGGGVYVYSAGETMATFNSNGAVNLYHDNAAKLATTSTGIDVTGTVTADGLTVDGTFAFTSAVNGIINNPASCFINIDSDNNNAGEAFYISRDADNTTGARVAKFDATGDISFYEDTGTTAKFFWDASAESLGIGTSSPSTALHVQASSGASRITVGTGGVAGDHGLNVVSGGASNDYGIFFNGSMALGSKTTTGTQLKIGSNGTETTFQTLTFHTNATEAMRIDSSGNLLVGTTEIDVGYTDSGAGCMLGPEGTLQLARSSANANLYLNKLDNDGEIINFRKDGLTVGQINARSGDLVIGTGTTGLQFYDVGNAIFPLSASGNTNRDAAIDLGETSNRFKNLYLSNAVKFGSQDALATDGTSNYVKSGSAIYFQPANTTKMLLDSSGNLLVGKTSIANSLGWGEVVQVGGANPAISLDNSSSVQWDISNYGGTFTIWNDGNERIRIDASGNLLVGTTSGTGHKIRCVASGSDRNLLMQCANGGTNAVTLNTSGTADYTAFLFTTDGGNTQTGSVVVGGSSTAYNTSSDQRLKDNIVDAPSASDDIDAIQVRSFDWKADGSHQKYGMVAQELQSVAPEAVSEGETEDDMMGVDYSKLVPMMMKEIQSLRARVAQLEGEN